MIDRHRPRPARSNQEKAGGPDAMRRPCAGIDKHLNHECHEQQRESREAACKAKHEQSGKDVFCSGGGRGGNCRVDERQSVLLRK